MSISRKNWSALSSLARQWTLEDEEEVERERRRRVKSSSSSADPDSDFSQASRDSPPGTDSQSLSSVEQIQLDFVEMLRVRDEKRRMRHVETLRQQKEEGGDEGAANGGGARVELLGDLDEEQGSVSSSVGATSEPQPSLKTASSRHSSSNGSADVTNRRAESSELLRKDPDPAAPVSPARKFVSSVSISLDKSSSVSGRSTPMSPLSPTTPLSPQQPWSPCQSPPPRGPTSPGHNGCTQETSDDGSSYGGTAAQTTKPAFVRQSSRTLSFRMMKKKEEESSPLQRSASVRMATKKFECNTDQNGNEESSSSFLRNSRQRVSSRSIQEKMERLAQAAQKSEIARSPDVTQRTLFLMEEVSRKRGLFEKDPQAAGPSSPGISRQEFRNFASGMSDRISRWLNKTNQTGSSHSSADLRHVDIRSKRSLFENTVDDTASQTGQAKD